MRAMRRRQRCAWRGHGDVAHERGHGDGEHALSSSSSTGTAREQRMGAGALVPAGIVTIYQTECTLFVVFVMTVCNFLLAFICYKLSSTIVTKL